MARVSNAIMVRGLHVLVEAVCSRKTVSLSAKVTSESFVLTKAIITVNMDATVQLV
jgi:hypothetical protein